jgi:hypothetical protein
MHLNLQTFIDEYGLPNLRVQYWEKYVQRGYFNEKVPVQFFTEGGSASELRMFNSTAIPSIQADIDAAIARIVVVSGVGEEIWFTVLKG